MAITASKPEWGGFKISLIFHALLLLSFLHSTAADIVFVEPNSPIIPTGASEGCRTVLSRNITECDSSVTVPHTGAPYTADELDITCAAACRSALATYITDIGSQCSPGLSYLTPEGWTLQTYAEMALDNFDVTCVRSGGEPSEYCSIVLRDLFNQADLETSPLCSECYIKVFQAKLNSAWGYSEGQETAYSSLLSSCTIPATSYPITYTPPPSTVTTTATGTETTSTPIARCEAASATYTVGPDDTCNSISAANSISNDWLVTINNLDSQCRGLVPGSHLCLPQPCRTHLVAVNETCNTIIESAGYPILLPIFLSWNVAINSDCTNIDTLVGKYICITPPGTTTIPEPDPTLPQDTLAPVPPNAEQHSNVKCATWHNIATGDTCAKLAVNYNIRLKDFYFLNPNVTSDCLNLMLDVSYCVKPVGSIWTYDGYNPYTEGISMTDTLDVGHTLTRYNYTNIHKFTPTTGWAHATNLSRVPPPDPTVTESYTLCPEWTDLPFDTDAWPEDEGQFPPEAYGNEEWLAEYQRVCEPDWSLPLPTDPPTFPPLDFPTVTGGTTTTGTTTTETETTTTTTTTTSSAPTVTPPGPVREGMATNCNGYHLHVSGDTCWSMATDAGITLEQFYSWNPAVGTDCGGLWPDYAYCISVAEATTTTTTPTTTTPTGRATAAPPGPTQEGASNSCVLWHLVTAADTEGCWGITQQYGITVEQFIAINPWVGEGCNIWGGYAYCIEEL